MADSQGLEAQYQAHYRTLAESESTPQAKATALAFFRGQFSAADWAPPAFFDHELIDKLIAIVRDEQGALKLRTDAAAALADLLRLRYAGECKPLSHEVVKRGAMALFAGCIATATDDGLCDTCILGAQRIFEGCKSCRAIDQDAAVIEAIAAQLRGGTILVSLDSTYVAVACVHAAMNPREEPYGNRKHTYDHPLISALAAAMRRYSDDDFVLRHALDSLKWMNRATVEAKAAEPGLLEQILVIIDTNKSHSVINPAMTVLFENKCERGSNLPAALVRWNLVIALPGFVPIMMKRLSSPSEGWKVRDFAYYFLDRMAEGPDAHIDKLLTEPTAVWAMMRFLLDNEDLDMPSSCRRSFHEGRLRSFWERLAHMIESLIRSPRPALLTNLLGSGIVPYFLEFGAKNAQRAEVAAALGTIFPALTLIHPEFSGLVEKAGLGHMILPRAGRVGAADYVIADEDAIEI